MEQDQAGKQGRNRMMTIHLPNDVERDILAEVQRGHFASVDDVLAEAWRSFRRQRQPVAPTPGQGLIGALRDDAELLDQAVEHAMKVGEERPWRLTPGE
jgi:Arc/MetJ-type ribon-helix-helix transcriptional regulator